MSKLGIIGLIVIIVGILSTASRQMSETPAAKPPRPMTMLDTLRAQESSGVPAPTVVNVPARKAQ